VLYEWAGKLQLRFNVEKCKVMYLRGARTSKKEYRMKQPNSNIATLQETVVEKDLGIWITNDLKPRGPRCLTSKPDSRTHLENFQLSGLSVGEAVVHITGSATPGTW